MKNAFIALALVLVVSTAFASLSSETKAKLQKINKSTFGRTIMETIQVELQSKEDPRPRIITLLQELQAEVISEQEAADASNKQAVQDHEDKVDELEGVIDERRDAIAAWEDELSSINNDLDQASDNLHTQEDLLSTFLNDLDTATAARDADHAHWEADDNRNGHILDILNKVREVITQRLAERSEGEFLQTSNKKLLANLAEVKEHINSKASRKISPGFSKLVYFIATKVEAKLQDPEDDEAVAALGTIVTFIDNLAQEVTSTRTQARENEEAAQDAFKEASDRLNEAIKEARATIDNLDTRITDLQQQRDAHVEQIADAGRTVEAKTAELEANNANFADAQAKFDAATHDRTEELSVIQEVLEIVQHQLTGLREYAENYLGSH